MSQEKILVLGLGNPILSDDGVGIHIVQQVSSLFLHPQVEYQECSLAGFGFLDTISGYQKLILADSINWQKNPPGTISVIKTCDLKNNPYLRNFHNLSLAGTLALADEMGIPRPKEIVILAVEAKDCSTFLEKCTPEVEKAIPMAVQMIVEQLKFWLSIDEEISIEGKVKNV